MAEMAKARRQLLRRLKELGERIEEIEEDLAVEPDPDWDDNAQLREDDEVLSRLSEDAVQEIARIHAALDRMKQGTWGWCTRCGDPIGEDRLSVLPETPLCRTCAMEMAT